MTAERTLPGPLHELFAGQSELVVRLNRWVFLAAEPGDVVVAPSAVAAAARCRHLHHPERNSFALVASPAATPADVAAVLDEIRGRSDEPGRVRVAADDELVVGAVRSAGFRLAVTSREVLVDCSAVDVQAAAATAATAAAAVRVGPVAVDDRAFLAALRDHYAATHRWDPPAPLTLDQVADLLLDGAVAGAAHAARRGDGIGEIVGVSVLHESDDASLAGDVAYCGPANVDDPAAADIVGVMFASRVLATHGVLRIEVDEGDGANDALAGALAAYRTEPAAGPDVLVYVTP